MKNKTDLIPIGALKSVIEQRFDMQDFMDILPCHLFDIIDEIPTISRETIFDQQIIRCKDCRFWGLDTVPGETDHVKGCHRAFWMVGENGYCVYGMKKEES